MGRMVKGRAFRVKFTCFLLRERRPHKFSLNRRGCPSSYVESRMEEYGLIIGAALLILVSLCAWALGAKANAGVQRFRSEHHESFSRRANR